MSNSNMKDNFKNLNIHFNIVFISVKDISDISFISEDILEPLSHIEEKDVLAVQVENWLRSDMRYGRLGRERVQLSRLPKFFLRRRQSI